MNILINQHKSVLDALQQLNEIRELKKYILFVTNEENQVIGSLTDGDIRRSLLEDKDLNKPIESICNKDFVFRYEDDDLIDLTNIQPHFISVLPILTRNKEFVRFIDLEKIKGELPVEAFLMAGGRGKRLSPLTDRTPKPMLLIGNKPILEHNIDRLIRFGVKHFYISVNYLGQQIKDYFKDGSAKGITIEYVEEENPLGTAGSLSLVNEYNKNHLLVMNSDILTNIDFSQLMIDLLNKQADMVVASVEHKVNIPYAVFETNAESKVITSFKEKPSFIYHCNSGIYLMKKEMTKLVENGTYTDMTDVMERAIENHKQIIYSPIHGYWIDIGNPIDYQQAQEFFNYE